MGSNCQNWECITWTIKCIGAILVSSKPPLHSCSHFKIVPQWQRCPNMLSYLNLLTDFCSKLFVLPVWFCTFVTNFFWPLAGRGSCKHNTDICWSGELVEKQLPIYTSSRYRAPLALIWSCVSDHPVNVSPILTLIFVLFCGESEPEQSWKTKTMSWKMLKPSVELRGTGEWDDNSLLVHHFERSL